MRTLLLLVALVVCLTLGIGLAAVCQGDATVDLNATAPEDSPFRGLAERSMKTMLARRLMVWSWPDGRPVYVSHCARAPGGCEARILALAPAIVDVAYNAAVNPILLAAITFREAGFNPFAEGSHGERGLMQLHPRGVGRGVRFVESERYREYCRSRADACQAEILRIGAEHLKKWLVRCGTVESALGGYNTGRCNGSARYARQVMQEQARLEGYLR